MINMFLSEMDKEIVKKWSSVEKGNETLFIMQEIRKLQDEPYTLQDRYTKYKNAQSSLKLYKLKDGTIATRMNENDNFIKFNNVKDGKIAICMMYELLMHLPDKEVDRFKKDLNMIIKLWLVKTDKGNR